MCKVVHQSQVAQSEVEMAGALGVRVQWLISPDDGAPNFFLRRFVVAKGGHTPRHKHPYEHEVYVLSGKGRVLVGGVWRDISEGFVVFIPPDVEHQFVNDGEDELVFLCMIPRSGVRS